MIEYFNHSGKIPVEMDLLQMCVIGEHIYLTLIFNNFVLISSHPDESLFLSDLIICVISCVEKDLKTGRGAGVSLSCL